MKRTFVLGLSLVALAAATACGGAAARGEGSQRVKLAVTQKGFEPATVKVRAGRQVTLLITRRTDRTCAKELVMKAHGIHKGLPLNRTVEITFTPGKAGALRYACGMDMIAGTIVVE